MAVNKPATDRSQSEGGNAFFIVMITIVLFAALMFTFARGARQGESNLSGKQSEVAASDILAYTQLVERGFGRAYGKALSENDISFENDFVSGYANANCGVGQDRCKIFNNAGGGAPYKPLGTGWSFSETDWIFTGSNIVLGVGQDCTAARCSDLLMLIRDVPLALCRAINEQLEFTAPGVSPPTDANVDTTMYTGSFAYDAGDDIGDEDASLVGARTACLLDTGKNEYIFYHTLLER